MVNKGVTESCCGTAAQAMVSVLPEVLAQARPRGLPVLHIHLSAEDLARIRFAPRPAPLYELNAALMMLYRTDDDPLFGRWRHRVRHSLPPGARPLGGLISGVRC